LLLGGTPLPIALGAPPTALAEGAGGERWQHPAGMISRETVRAMREKCARYAWARKVRDDLFSGVKPWLEVSMDRLRELTPRRRTNVYHNFSCPDDRSQLKFDPFNDRVFTCPRCGKTYPPD